MHILTLSHVLAKVVYTPEFWNKNFLKFLTTKLQPHSSKVSKRNIFQSNLDYKHLSIKINQKNIQTICIRQLCIGKDRLISVKLQ